MPLRRACSASPSGPALLASYPELATRDAGRSIAAAAPGSRSGLLPARGEPGCYLVVLVAKAGTQPRVDTFTAAGGGAPPDDLRDEQARRLLAAHIDDMATSNPPTRPVDPVQGQLPLITLPGHLPEPATPAAPADRPGTETRRRCTAA